MKTYIIVKEKEHLPHASDLKRLREVSNVNVILHTGSLAEVKQLQNDPFEKIIALSAEPFDWKFDVESLDNIPNVKAIFTQTTDFEWLKPEELAKRNIAVSNCPGYSTDAVAEYAMSMAIECARKTALHMKNNFEPDWSITPMLLKGKTIGIVGLGNIGKRIAEIAKVFGMNVVYWSRATRSKKYEYVELDELFKTADVVIPTMQTSPSTVKIITKKHIRSMKKNSIVVSIARNLVPEKFILERVEKAMLGGYAFEGEAGIKMNQHIGNVWVVPQIAWYTDVSIENDKKMWAENAISYLLGKPKNIAH